VAECPVRILWQPVVRLDTGRVAGHEALARFHGMRPAAAFRAAHRQGGAADLDSVCRAVALCDPPRHGSVFVNVHAATLHSIVGEGTALGAGRAEARRVVWELPESAGWPDDPASIRRIRSGLPPGSRIALDDVGSGHRDLRRLVALRPAWVKLDRALVSGVARSTAQQHVIRAVADLAGRLGARTVAEGIERYEDAQCLRHLGVCYGQGFLFMQGV
jgi:EAL domain-containing protein (putative c-di-GMP-specific phosphodiesterase class I)